MDRYSQGVLDIMADHPSLVTGILIAALFAGLALSKGCGDYTNRQIDEAPAIKHEYTGK